MADVVSLWSRARRDPEFRKQLLANPQRLLAGTKLRHDELEMLEVAVRALDPLVIPVLFERDADPGAPVSSDPDRKDES
ncbi:MAG: hypothetical protein N2037_10925 [Acidimicrobiales bacterium]|nr:hypothetical protein [Acidimicrobiales bacterium]